MPVGLAIGLLLVGILLGSIFTFGMQHWNREISRDSCTLITTQFLSYNEIRQHKHPTKIKEIAIDCANGETYFIDGTSINTKLRNALTAMSEQEHITLLIHPNSNTILELSTERDKILVFEDTIHQLDNETTGFLLLGIFLYICSLVSLFHLFRHFLRRKKAH